MLTLQNVSVRAGAQYILEHITISFERGRVYALMGPNGSGKSTLAHAVMGNPGLMLMPDSRIAFEGVEIQSEPPEGRAQRGMFLSFQSPVALAGVSVYQLLCRALEKKQDARTVLKYMREYADALKIRDELLSRPLNEDFSGGEKKKMEVLQAAMLDPKFVVFDEIDTGVDVDALQTISDFLRTWMNPQRTIVLITHYNRILKHVRPDTVLVLRKGALAAEGGAELAEHIEAHGYEKARMVE